MRRSSTERDFAPDVKPPMNLSIPDFFPLIADTGAVPFVKASGPFQKMAVHVLNAMGRGLMNVPSQ